VPDNVEWQWIGEGYAASRLCYGHASPARDDVSPGSDVVQAPLGLYTGPSLNLWV